MKNSNKIISKKLATEAAREHFGVQRLRGDAYVGVLGGSSPYHLFIYKGQSFEIR